MQDNINHSQTVSRPCNLSNKLHTLDMFLIQFIYLILSEIDNK